MAIAMGAAADGQPPLATVVIASILSSTFLTLVYWRGFMSGLNAA